MKYDKSEIPSNELLEACIKPPIHHCEFNPHFDLKAIKYLRIQWENSVVHDHQLTGTFCFRIYNFEKII